MSKFRKKPVVIDAVQYNGFEMVDGTRTPMFDLSFDGPDWLIEAAGKPEKEAGAVYLDDMGRLAIVTLEGVMFASHDDYIIRGVQGEIYPCKPAIFAKTYEPAGIDNEPLDAQLVLALLYEHEINCGITSYWDEGYRAWIGDDLNGRQVEAEFHPNPAYGRPITDIGNWLWQSAVTLYPEIEMPRDVPTIAAE